MNKEQAEKAGCICFDDWQDGDINNICQDYEEDSHAPGQCAFCEHDEDCHESEKRKDSKWL